MRSAVKAGRPASTSDTSVLVPPTSKLIRSGKPAAAPIAAAPITPAAGPDTQVRTGKRDAVSTDISPPLEWKISGKPAAAPIAAAPTTPAAGPDTQVRTG